MLKSVLGDLARGVAQIAGRGTQLQHFLPAIHDRLHLGCGTNLLAGWINVDIDGPPEAVRWDLTRTLPLPSNSVRFVYSEHFIEHIRREQAAQLLSECHRVLVADGVLRLSTPSLGKLIAEYDVGRLTEWLDVGWSPSTPCQMVNEAMRSWGHQFLYDEPELEVLLRHVGFVQVTHVAWRESSVSELRGLECRPFHGEIIVEAVK